MIETCDVIANLDLEPIMVKLMDKDEGEGWALEFTQRVANEYRRFLTLCLENPRFSMVPSIFVDKFWHFHILDTLKYQEDCQRIFGHFLHHFPYFGMRGEDDAENLKQAWSESCDLYEKRYGTIDQELWPRSARCPNCGRRCPESGYFREDRPKLRLSA
jgi:hypothetical protein